jgi:hypothetical protein
VFSQFSTFVRQCHCDHLPQDLSAPNGL